MGETKTAARAMSTSGRSTAASAEASSLSAAEGRLPDSPATSSDTVELDERSGELVQVTLGPAAGGAGLVYGPPPPTLSTFSAAASLERVSKSRQQSLERRPAGSRSQSRQSHHSVSSQLYGQPHYEPACAGYDPFDDPAVEVAIEPTGRSRGHPSPSADRHTTVPSGCGARTLRATADSASKHGTDRQAKALGARQMPI